MAVKAVIIDISNTLLQDSTIVDNTPEMVKALRNCNIDFFASNDFGIAFSLWEKRSSFDITSEDYLLHSQRVGGRKACTVKLLSPIYICQSQIRKHQ